jgi:hypothetical protein
MDAIEENKIIANRSYDTYFNKTVLTNLIIMATTVAKQILTIVINK